MKRSNKHNFSRSCKCLTHDIWAAECSVDESNDFSNVVNFTSRRRFKKSVLDYMVEKKLLSEKCNYLCIGCYNNASKKTGDKVHEEPEKKRARTNVSDPVRDALITLETFPFKDLINHQQLWEKLILLIGAKLCKKDMDWRSENFIKIPNFLLI